jgi:hypothetical protein
MRLRMEPALTAAKLVAENPEASIERLDCGTTVRGSAARPPALSFAKLAHAPSTGRNGGEIWRAQLLAVAFEGGRPCGPEVRGNNGGRWTGSSAG